MLRSSISGVFATAIAVGGAVVSTSTAEAAELAKANGAPQLSKIAFSDTARAQLYSRRAAALKRRAQPDDPEGWEKQFLHQLKAGKSFEDRMTRPSWKRGNAFKAYQKYLSR